MQPLPHDLERIFGELTDTANRIVAQFWRNIPQFETKHDTSPVTVADKAIEEALRKLLNKLTPGFGIFGEEFAPEGMNHEFTWVIDPIDGTKGFLVGGPMFTNLIALCHHGKPIAGLMNAPILRENYTAIGGITRLNGRPIRTRSHSDISSAVGFFSAQDMRYTPQQHNIVAQLRAQVLVNRANYDSYAYGLMAQGFTDISCEMGMEPYDRMALAPIIEGAGGVMTNWQGEPITMDSGTETLAACCPAMHQIGLASIKKSRDSAA